MRPLSTSGPFQNSPARATKLPFVETNEPLALVAPVDASVTTGTVPIKLSEGNKSAPRELSVRVSKSIICAEEIPVAESLIKAQHKRVVFSVIVWAKANNRISSRRVETTRLARNARAKR